jgi:hypothetical protein
MKIVVFALFVSFAMLATAQGEDQPTGTVTIFREAHTTAAPFNFSSKDQWPKNFHAVLMIDKVPAVDMHADQFVSLTLPAGRHLIEFKKIAGGSAQFELHPGERLFVRPAWGGSIFRPSLLMTVVPCKVAIQLGKDTTPVPAKYAFGIDALTESRFPSMCPEDHSVDH